MRLMALSFICPILPDAHVLGFYLGIAYEDFWDIEDFSIFYFLRLY